MRSPSGGRLRDPDARGRHEPRQRGPARRAGSKVARRYSEMIAAGRIGCPQEAAEAALWLCSDAASYVTGHSMIVDGGLTAAVR